MNFFSFSVFYLLLIHSAIASASELDPSTLPSISNSTVFGVYSFLILLALITGYFLWKKGSFKMNQSMGASRLKVIENKIVSPKQCLMVVEYEGEKMLLGISPGIIQHLCFLDKRQVRQKTKESASFENLLQVEGVKETLLPAKRSKKEKQRG